MINLSKTARDITWSTLVQYGGKIVQLVLGVISTKLITNFLGQTDYGAYAAVVEYCLFFSVAANLGLFANVVKKMSDAPKDGKLFVNALLLRLGSATVFLGVAALALPFFAEDAFFVWASLVFIGALMFDYVTSICDAMLQANYMMGRATFALVVGKIINVALLTLMIVDFSYQGGLSFAYEGLYPSTADHIPLLFIAPLLSGIVTMALSLWFVHRQVKLKWHFDWMVAKDLLMTGIPFGIINVLNNLYFRFLPMYLADHFLDKAAFGTFDISYRIAFVLSLFSTFMVFSVMPAFKRSLSAGELRRARKYFTFSWQLMLLAGIGLVLGGSLLGPWALELLTHKKYFLPEYWYVLPSFLVLAAVSYFYDLVLLSLFSLDREIWFLKREIIALACACVFFAGAYFFPGIDAKLGLILVGAIVGEVVMVIGGMREMWRVLYRG